MRRTFTHLVALAAGLIVAAGAALVAPFRRDDAYAAPAINHEPLPQRHQKPRVGLVVKSRQFLGSLMARLRPMVTPRWRMCPSA